MNLAYSLTAILVGVAAIPTAWVLGREAVTRRRTRLALAQIEAARALIAGSDASSAAALARSLAERFDAVTRERVVVSLLRSPDPPAQVWGARLFGELGLVDTYGARLRTARRWTDRENAAEILGLAAHPASIPALVDTLRDKHEDEASVKTAAAGALARLRDPTAIPLLVGQLAATDDQSSRTVAESVVGFGPMAVPALLEVLADPARNAARVWAARILGRVRDPRAVEDLIGRLHDRDDRLRMAAAEALGVIGDPRGLQPVVRATLRDPAPQVRAHAAGAVAAIEGDRAVDVLVAALADPDYATRIRALEAFDTMRIEDTSPLETALRDPNGEVRRRAALALERVGYLERVVGDLTDEDPAVREPAYASLLMLGEVGLADSVASYLHHASFEVRALAARACGDLGAARLGAMLLRAIDDEAWPVRAAVCNALGRLRHEAAIKPLVQALGDREEPVREAAAEALVAFPAEALASDAASFVAAYEGGTVVVRRSLVVLVGRVRDASADSLIVRATVDPSDGVRLAAVTALADRPDAVKVEPLVARLTDASLDVRMVAVSGLGSAASAEAFEGLLRALPGAARDVRERIAESLARGARATLFARLGELEASESLDVLLGIAWTLGKTGDARGVPTLGRFLHSSDAALRASAAGALAKIAHPSSTEALVGVAGDPDGRVRAAVVSALARIGGGDERVLATLHQRTRDPDAFVRNRALVALASSAGASTEDRVRAAAGMVDRAAFAVALAFVGTDAAFTTCLEELAQPHTFEAVLAFLGHEDPRIRAGFFGALHLGDPAETAEAGQDTGQIAGQYEKALRTSLDVDARRMAVQGLARLGLPRAVPVLCDAATGDPHESVRLRATRALADVASDEMPLRALLRAVADPSPEVAIAAVRAVTRVPDERVTRALQTRLGVGGDELGEVLEETLAERHRADPTAFLDWMMGVDVPDQQAPALRVLARIVTASMVPLLRELGRSRSVLVRVETVRALGRLPLPDVAELVDEMVNDPHETVRLALVETVGAVPEAITRLAVLRRDPSVAVRGAAATALERVDGIAARGAHRALEQLLADSSVAVRAAALTSLIGSRDPQGLLAFGKAWPRTTLGARAELQREPRAAAISDRIAMRLTSSQDPEERRCAVVALGALGAPGFPAWVVPALRDPSSDVRLAAVQALASVRDEAVGQAIGEMLSDPDSEVRDAARRTLVHSVG